MVSSEVGMGSRIQRFLLRFPSMGALGFCFVLSSAQSLLLTLCSGITPEGLGNLIIIDITVMLGIKFRSATCKWLVPVLSLWPSGRRFWMVKSSLTLETIMCPRRRRDSMKGFLGRFSL